MRILLRWQIIIFSAFLLPLFLLFPKAASAGENFTDKVYDASAFVRVTVNPELHRPTTLRLAGSATVRSSAPSDVDSDSKLDIQTELVSMNLTGSTPQGLAINLNSSKSNIYRSLGMTEELARMPLGIGGTNLPANSFFDVFTELTLGAPSGGPSSAPAFFDVFLTDTPFHLQAISKNLTDQSGVYTTRKNITVTLFRNGVPAGTLTFLAVNLNSSKSN